MRLPILLLRGENENGENRRQTSLDLEIKNFRILKIMTIGQEVFGRIRVTNRQTHIQKGMFVLNPVITLFKQL